MRAAKNGAQFFGSRRGGNPQKVFYLKGECDLPTELTSKEKLFCAYYCLGRNGREAAAKSGYRFGERSAARLLKKKEIAEYIEKNGEREKRSLSDAAAGYYRLAFGCVSDAVRILFDDEINADNLERMDLFNIAEIKRQKGGAIEIKFFDRLKALERLEQICSAGENTGSSLYSAIERGAAAIAEDGDERGI